MKKSLAVSVLLFVVNTALWAQQGFTFNRISTDDGIGLASNVVYCAYQDAKGFIWVGTANGLQRFDGTKFIQLSSEKSTHSLLVSNLTQIVPIDSVSLWLCFPYRQEFGIFNTTTLRYTRVPLEPAPTLVSKSEFRLWKDSEGETFLSVYNYGILHYNPKQNRFVNDNYFRFPKGWSVSNSFFEDTLKKQYWFPCGSKGFAVFDKKEKQLYTQEYNPKNIPLLTIKKIQPGASDVFIDRERRHWLFNWPAGIHYKRCFDSTGKELGDTIGLYRNPAYTELRHFYETRSGLLWMYGVNALYNYDRNNRRFYEYEHAIGSSTGIQFQHVYQVMEDHDGSVWVCTDNGLYFTSPGSGTFGVVNMLFDTEKGGTEFTDIIQLRSGAYWLSTWGRGIYTLDKNLVRHENDVYAGMPAVDPVTYVMYRQAWALYEHSDGKIWIGCQGGHYIVYDPATHSSRFQYLPESKRWTIRYITGDSKQQIWIGTFGGALIRYDGKKFSTAQQLGSIITKILVDKEGLLWVACENNGIFCISADGMRILKHYTSDTKENRLFINTGKDIEQLDDSTIVFGAGAMNFINKRTGKVHWLTFDDGLPSNTIQRIRIDGSGYLWMVTLNGICRYNPVTKRVTSYGRKDGITLAHLTTEADYFCKQGFVLFTGGNALTYFKPGVFESKQPPDVRITDFKLFNTYLPVDSLLCLPRVELPNTQHSFSIFFSALSYVQKEKLTYYYRMTGIDKDWIRADRQQVINYSLLPPGTYTFSVFCEDIDGTRSKHITTLTLHIRPPFWRTYTFLAICIVLVGLGVYLIDRVRINKLLAVEKLRIRVARDLHDDMGSTLSTINILSSMAKTKVNTDPVRTTEYLGKISDNSQRMMDAMDDIVWSIKPSNDSMHKITARMREFAINVLEAKEIEMDFRVDEEVYTLRLNMEVRRDFFLVFKEAINNAAKYSRASMVTIQLDLRGKHLVLVVKDDGTGFNPEEADNGNGLGNMQKRADAMHAQLVIDSSPGKGTRVMLDIPVD